ncbi:MAG TPA: hypothetical protein VI653_12835 [Steroidobacteraceae bacterium]
MRWMVHWMARRSLLARDTLQVDSDVLGGLSTYILKLGAANLVPPYNTDLDRRFAASPAVMSMRIRLQQLAHLLADGLRDELTARKAIPLHLLSIGGGTAIDCLNALILLRKSHPSTLERSVTLEVLDPDPEAPEFGARALASLASEGGPLNGLAVNFAHIPYSWKSTATLADLVRRLSASDSVIAASTEGALFEYADDATVLSNLEALYPDGSSKVTLVTGTVTRADALTRDFITTSRFRLMPRGHAAFGALVRQARFTMTQVRSSILSDQVLLRPG